MSTEPVPYPEFEAQEPNSKKKLQPATGSSIDREPGDLAGLIMWLPRCYVEGLPSEYGYYNCSVVILSPSVSHDKTVEILGMASFNGKCLAKKFNNSPEGINEKARYLPIEPTPPHPDTPERNAMLKVLPYHPKEPWYVDGSSRQSVRFSALKDYVPFKFGYNYGVYPQFYLDKDSYQKLAAFVGFSTVGILHAPANPEVDEKVTEQLTEQLAAKDELDSSLLPSHDANIPLPVMNQQAEPETTQEPGHRATGPPVLTHSRSTSPASFTPLVSLEERTWRQEFNKAFHRQLASQYGVRNAYSDSTHGALDLSKPARNHIRIVLAFIAMLSAGRALSRSTVGREVFKEAVAGVKAMMVAGVSNKLVVAMMNTLARMAWAVARHSGRNWWRYSAAALGAGAVYEHEKRYPGGRGTKWDQILMLAWDVACLRIVE